MSESAPRVTLLWDHRSSSHRPFSHGCMVHWVGGEEGLAKVNTDSAKYKANTSRYKEYGPISGLQLASRQEPFTGEASGS